MPCFAAIAKNAKQTKRKNWEESGILARKGERESDAGRLAATPRSIFAWQRFRRNDERTIKDLKFDCTFSGYYFPAEVRCLSGAAGNGVGNKFVQQLLCQDYLSPFAGVPDMWSGTEQWGRGIRPLRRLSEELSTFFFCPVSCLV